MEVLTSLSSSSSSNFERRGIAAAVGGEDGGVLSSSSSMKDVRIISSSHVQMMIMGSVIRPLPGQASCEGRKRALVGENYPIYLLVPSLQILWRKLI